MDSRSYIDPSITPASDRQRKVLDAIRKRGLSLSRVHRDGNALRLTGSNVFVLVADLSSLSKDDLDPPTRSELAARMRTLSKSP